MSTQPMMTLSAQLADDEPQPDNRAGDQQSDRGGQREDAFRTDLPVTWLLTTTHVVMNAAAEEVRAGRLDADDAPWFIGAILLPAFTQTQD
ncbi:MULTISPECIES: hypothetical protein [Gordonia]|uniref:Uncharacterized protein n=3 Tax=Gordonia TaxID=2053 RepID=A0AAE4U5B5_9ACTN|nr:MULTISPECIES: hypothetical protein [Gordonia]KSU52955.1 hypothetical protein AS181_22585 [Gordonia sp. SGD-V-85]MCZ0912906.1 hypothetical protein [Gordonia amicalis]MCZ4654120.1 hypothetical protein [Gordonia amicalis]MDJ0453237.1 hypothetical protein [Gordonia amicalis]MDS1114927.1 hypothetical protein [Gordonia westfalica]